MGLLKQFAESVSVDMGFGGLINEQVIREAKLSLKKQAPKMKKRKRTSK